ncbi:MAG: pentapeptide repeat-containing protein [Chlorobiaceae bacterium]|nr:pentapeptide repeat-containing protein [Chlorobiaceae bacterium]NTW10876.1 pentapeptide repeat-containing protein [Chlorobiaceae bacterium]
MTTEGQREILEKGVEHWNRWRTAHPDAMPELAGARLSGRNLRGVDFHGAKLSHAVLAGADLGGADLGGADLRGTDLSGADLVGVNLGKSTIDASTKYEGIKGCEIGVNGFYSAETDSAALMRIDPPGNTMQGPNVDAVLESLKHARKLHTFSLILAGIALLFIIIKPTSVTLPYLAGSFKFDDLSYSFLATFLSSGMLSLVSIFLDSALQGARYLNDRRAAVLVGHFPWLISKYEHDPLLKRQSRIMRLFLSFHPVIYFYFFVKWDALFIGDWAEVIRYYTELPVFLGELMIPVFYIILLRLSLNIFRISEGFQKPILFDTETELARRSEMERLAEAFEKQAARTAELVELFRRQDNSEK